MPFSASVREQGGCLRVRVRVRVRIRVRVRALVVAGIGLKQTNSENNTRCTREQH